MINRKYVAFCLGLAGALIVAAPVLSYAQNDSLLSFVSVDPDHPGKGLTLADPAAAQSFYDARGGKPAWSASDAEDILEILEDSWTHGLNPATYHAPEIAKILEQGRLVLPAQKTRLDLMLTDAVIRYGRDVTGMRVDPALIRQKAEFWRAPLAPSEILERVASSGDPAEALEELAPQGKMYNTLRAELERLSEEPDDSAEPPMTFGGAYIFAPGKSHKDVIALRRRLDVTHRSEDGPETYYDDRTAAAVMAFQKQYGLDSDGKIGSKTLALLNRTRQDKIDQVIANLERLRWLEQDLPERYILVNIPSQMLWAVEDGETKIEMPVVVGMPQRQTRDFSATITGVRFNPTWTVPMGIKVADMLPKLQEDPYALVEKGIEMFDGLGRNANTIDPGDIDWATISRADLAKIQMVQTPGDHNALGRVRVMMPNEFDMYLHDTNHKDLFVKEDRTLSSGCVRLSDPRRVAAFLLSHNEGWSANKVDEMIAADKTVEVPIQTKMPVYIVYQTIWTDEDGELVYGPDVYKRDRKLIEVLQAMNGYSLPDSPDDSRLAHAAGAGESARVASAR